MHIRNTLVRPPPMNEKKLGKEPELSKGVVGGHGSLGTFETEKTASNVRLLNHSNVVSTITNRERHRISSILDLIDRKKMGLKFEDGGNEE
jgi:hypothetical protein